MNLFSRIALLAAVFLALLHSSNAQKEVQIMESGPIMEGANNPKPINFPTPDSYDRFVQYREKNGLKGFQNTHTGEWVIEPIYEQIDASYEKSWYVATLGGKQGLLDKKGKVLLPFEFEQIQNPPYATIGRRDTVMFRHFIVQKNGLYGLFDLLGREIEPIEWLGGTWVNGDHVLFFKKKTQKLLNWKCETVFEHHFEDWSWVLEYDNIQKKRFWKATDENGENRLFDLQGRAVLPDEYLGFDWSNGNFICAQKERYGINEIVNLQGRRVLPPRFGRIDPMPHGLFMAWDFDLKQMGVVDSTGKTIVPFEYNLCYVVGQSGFIAVRKKDEMTAIFDTAGHQLSELIYSEDVRWQTSSPNMLQVQLLDGKWRVIGPKGLIIIDLCDDIKFSKTAIVVERGEWMAFFHPDGKPATDFKYKNAKGFLTEKQANQLAKDVRLPAHLTLLGGAVNANNVQCWIANNGQEFQIPKN